MRQSVRLVATVLALGFAASFIVRGVWWTTYPIQPGLLVASVAVYSAAVLAVVLVDVHSSPLVPLWAGLVALATAVLVPVGANMSLAPADRTEPFATWYVGGVGVLAVILMVRRRPVLAWTALGALGVTTMLFLGPSDALRLGLVGSITWVALAHLLVVLRRRLIADTGRLTGIQQAVSAWQSSQEVRRRERRVRAHLALDAAGPVLSRAVATGGRLTDDERLEARLVEGALRDELRGADLLDDGVREAIQEVRRRGSVVTVLDEGGLRDIAEEGRRRIRRELADTVRSATSERLIIRAGRDPRVVVTVVGRATQGADEDSVELFYEISRSDAARE